jgi:ABC-type branched-subunit amino acid transport system ATPase component/ABC-type branched-subunit amino acid transport system permease subunit
VADHRARVPGGAGHAALTQALAAKLRAPAAALGACLLLWPVAAAVLPHGLPAGVVLFGAVFGALYALTAMGLVLVYRANRVVNFAQAELGTVGAIVAIQLVNQRGWAYLVAVPFGLAVATLVGAGVEAGVIRRFRTAPRLILSVATIGVAQILSGVSLLVATLIRGTGARPLSLFRTPFRMSFTIQPVIFRGDHVAAMIAVPAVAALLIFFLRTSGYGVAVRAAADNRDRASLLGIPVRRLSTLVWAIASMLSALAVVLRAPIVGISPISLSGGGNALLLRSLACAVVARMESLPVTAVAAIVLGIVEQAAYWSTGQGAIVDGFLFVVILAALIARRGYFSRASEALTTSWRAIREVRPIPAELARLPEVRVGLLVLGVAAAGLAILFPLFATPNHEQLMSLIFIYSIIAVSLVVLTGWAGQISLGHFALAGFGGATTSVLYGRHGWDVLAAATAGVIVAGLISFLIGLPALQIRGPFLAVTTLGLGVAASFYFLQDRHFPWLIQRSINRPVLWRRLGLDLDWQMYYLCLVVLALVVIGVRGLRHSHTGRAIIAMRDNELAAQSVSLSATRLKLTAFVISGALAGLAGSLYVLLQHGLQPGSFNAQVSVRLFSMVVIGGLGSVPGAILGAVYVRGAEFFLPAAWQLIASGAGILLLLVVFPGGLGDVVYRIRDWILRRVAARRSLVVPSLVADVAVGETGRRIQAYVPSRAVGSPLLCVRDLDVAYDGVQVLFGVNCEVYEGEIVALLGTNGAGKSTLLKAISGLVPPSAGSIAFAGHELAGDDPVAIVRRGITQMPGGRGIFPSLSVNENLRMALWLHRADREYADRSLEQVLGYFPALARLRELPAGALSGGEQQMLSLAQAFLAKPALLLIDELSLGLAPTVVDHLLEIVRAIHSRGTTVVIVEQSVNTALRLAERAIFMEKGEVRFTGPTSELMDRPDVLRAVFLQGAAAALEGDGRPPAAALRTPDRGTGDRPVVLRTVGLVKRYGGIEAVSAVSLELHEGEILGLIGPNGAGKTTLYDLVSGFQAPDAGRVVLHGDDITSRPAHLRARAGLGRSFQDARLFPSLTVREALAVALARSIEATAPLAAMTRLPLVKDSERAVRRRVEELIELMSLQAFRDKFVAELSTGSRRVVEIAAMLAHAPSVLLLDEPSSGIAQREAEALGPLLARLRDLLNCSLIVIEHDMPLISRLAERIVALDQGSVIAEGSPEEVTRHPLVVESYLGAMAESLMVQGNGQTAARTTRARTRPSVRSRSTRAATPLRLGEPE